MASASDRPPWHPERVVDAALAARLVASSAPELAPARVEAIGTGWDNTVFLVNDAFVFRFPRRAIAVELLENELRVLPRLAPALPIPIPVPVFEGAPALGYPWPFAGYRYLPGRPATRRPLTDFERRAAAPVLGRFLRALHGVDPAEAPAPPDAHGRLDVAAQAPLVRERFAHLRALGLVPDGDRWADRFESAAAEAPAPAGKVRVVHGDLYAAHLLVDDAGAVTGIIDWGDVHTGHPAVDLSLVFAFLPEAARDAFLAAYGPIDDETRRLAWLRAVRHTVMVLAYGDDAGRPDLVREGRVALAHLEGGPG